MIKLSNEMKTVDAGSYYRDQLNSIQIDEYGVRIKLRGLTETNWFTLNKESIHELKEWLNKNKTKIYETEN